MRGKGGGVCGYLRKDTGGWWWIVAAQERVSWDNDFSQGEKILDFSEGKWLGTILHSQRWSTSKISSDGCAFIPYIEGLYKGPIGKME